LALENARLQALVRVQLAEVRASRARIIEAGDRERRRIERNLHDGAQQRLVGLALLLRMTEREVNGDKSAHTHVTRALDEAQAALQDLRDLATGLHPRVLARHGLAAALASLADRSDVPVSVDADLNGRLPEAVEACAYFISSEALQNVSKHAGATRVWVHARRLNGELAIEIGDDGVGGARLEEGGGLQGLRDRVEAIGGALTLESPVGAGTVVRAVLPV
jgi:signal transduction histidine kinase